MESRKKLLFVSHEFSVNGSSISLLSLIKGIRKINKNIEITVLIPLKYGKRGQAKKLFLGSGIKIKQILYRNNYKEVGARKLLEQYMCDLCNFVAVGVVCLYSKRKHFDYICSNSSAVDVGARAAQLTRIPHIYYVREFMEEDHGIEYRNKIRMKKLLESSRYIIFISKAIEKKYRSLYKLQNTCWFYDGFVLADYYMKNRSILDNKIIHFIQVGNYSDGKGTLNSVKLISRLINKGIENVRIEFVGNGSDAYKEQMTALIAEEGLQNYIKMSPYNMDIKEKLQKTDILLMNSRSEGFGRVTVEGMLAGCLAIGRNSGGTQEIITDGKNGLLFDSETDFVNIIQRVIKDRKHYKQIAQKGQKWAAKQFEYKRSAQNFIDFIT